MPDTVLRNELLRCYVEHVHGYMPLLDLQDFLQIIDRGDGETGQVSLLLFQCVMFAGASFVDLHHLICAGYPTRKFARKALFQKARVSDFNPRLEIWADQVLSYYTISTMRSILSPSFSLFY